MSRATIPQRSWRLTFCFLSAIVFFAPARSAHGQSLQFLRLHKLDNVVDPVVHPVADGGRPIAGVIQARDGLFYGTTICGGGTADCTGLAAGTVFASMLGRRRRTAARSVRCTCLLAATTAAARTRRSCRQPTASSTARRFAAAAAPTASIPIRQVP